MSKSPFEIRLELLHFARDMLAQSFEMKRYECERNHDTAVTYAQSANHLPPPLNYTVEPPSYNEILELARKLDTEFVSKINK